MLGVEGEGREEAGEETPLELAGEGHSSRLVSLLDNNNKTVSMRNKNSNIHELSANYLVRNKL